MELLSPFKSLRGNADALYPDNIEIDKRAFRRAVNRYFIALKLLDNQEIFSKTYYSEGGLVWFIWNDFIYFHICQNSDYYYGKKHVDF